MQYRYILIICVCFLSIGCRQRLNQEIPADPELQHRCVKTLTDVIVYDIFSPPVASRLYAYTNLAYFEALRPGYANYPSLTDQLKGFDKPAEKPGADCHYPLSAAVAFMTVARQLVFSKDSITNAEKQLLGSFSHLDQAVIDQSQAWGRAVAKVILDRAARDNYSQTRSMPKHSVLGETGVWKQTPPDYADATEPHWSLIRPLLLDSAAQCKPKPAIAYSEDRNSPFFKEVEEVFELSKRIDPRMDTIARYWDDNPFVTEHVGHLTYANKKTTPVGHWMGITAILSRQKGLDEIATAQAYALSAAAIFDGFISCWEEKFRSRTVRPITVIREHLSPEWNSLLQTPSFPEYTSGHSVISAAAATVLTKIFGSSFAFLDTTEKEYLGMERHFTSIEAAADEAGMSRLYGGIHFRQAIEEGKAQGTKLGLLYTKFIK